MTLEKSVKAAFAGMLLQAAVIPDCNMSEKTLVTQYIMVEKEGKGALHRIYYDNSIAGQPKRCKAEFDITHMEERGDRYLLILGEGRYYVEQR